VEGVGVEHWGGKGGCGEERVGEGVGAETSPSSL
jgi:hypothetical protein